MLHPKISSNIMAIARCSSVCLSNKMIVWTNCIPTFTWLFLWYSPAWTQTYNFLWDHSDGSLNAALVFPVKPTETPVYSLQGSKVLLLISWWETTQNTTLCISGFCLSGFNDSNNNDHQINRERTQPMGKR